MSASFLFWERSFYSERRNATLEFKNMPSVHTPLFTPRWQMRSLVLGLCLALCAAAAPQRVAVLDPATWADALAGRRWLVYFTVQGCKHCKRMGPMMEEVAAQLDSAGDPQVGRVDATAHNGLARTFGIQKYPSIFIFHEDGFHYEFSGGRGPQTIVPFARGGFARGGGTVTPSELKADVSDLWLFAEMVWPSFKTALSWALGIALAIKGVATLLLRLLKPALEEAAEDGADDGRRRRAGKKKD